MWYQKFSHIEIFRPKWVNCFSKKGKMIMFFTDIFPRCKNGGFLPKMFYEASINLLPNPEQDFAKGIKHQFPSCK